MASLKKKKLQIRRKKFIKSYSGKRKKIRKKLKKSSQIGGNSFWGITKEFMINDSLSYKSCNFACVIFLSLFIETIYLLIIFYFYKYFFNGHKKIVRKKFMCWIGYGQAIKIIFVNTRKLWKILEISRQKKEKKNHQNEKL